MKDKYDIDRNDIENDGECLEKLLAEADIHSIVDKGVREKESFMKYLINSIRKIGLHNIFHDKAELSIITISAVLFLYLSALIFSNEDKYYLYKFSFVASPVIYLVVILFSFINSKARGAFKLEMTCKVNFCQITALRIFIFSILSMIINTVSIVILWINGRDINLLRAVVISATGLFFFSAVFIFLLIKIKWKLSMSFMTVWIILNMFIASADNKLYIDFLLNVPLYVHLIISAVCIVLYIRNLNILINFRNKRGEV